jgi:hypothetical protein
MNDRIKELAIKAQVEHCISHVRLEEFAELIVQECAHLVDTLNEAYDAPSTAGKFIKNHFGIEIHSDKDYEIGTIEECEKFAESRRKPLEKNE